MSTHILFRRSGSTSSYATLYIPALLITWQPTAFHMKHQFYFPSFLLSVSLSQLQVPNDLKLALIYMIRPFLTFAFSTLGPSYNMLSSRLRRYFGVLSTAKINLNTLPAHRLTSCDDHSQLSPVLPCFFASHTNQHHRTSTPNRLV